MRRGSYAQAWQRGYTHSPSPRVFSFFKPKKNLVHWSAIAVAIPRKVTERKFARSWSGAWEFHLAMRLPDFVTWNSPRPTIEVGVSLGRPLSQRWVVFCASCPNCQG